MSLPMSWVEKIFKKLTLTYGRDFTDRWHEDDLEDVKADWAHELRFFQQSPASIAYGLEHCITGKPPTVQDFKAACYRKPEQPTMLPSPTVNPEIAAKVLGGLKQAPVQQNGMKDWAYRLKARHAAGEKLNRNQIIYYRQALGEISASAN